MKSLKSALTGLMFTVLASPALAQSQQGSEPLGPPYGYGHMMWYGPGSWDGWHPGFFFGPLFMLLVLAGIVLFVMLLGRVFAHPGHGHGFGLCHRGVRGAAMDILAERLAKGEIDKAEFEEKRKLLGG